MVQEKGTISINTENIFPIIKKFLYSDNEIFLRELVSNAVDATQKIKRLSSLGHYNKELGELKVKIVLDADAKTITISDNGIGMTAEEIKKYNVKEDWFFDKQRSVLDVRIIGLCAIQDKYNPDGSYKGPVPLFWIYFPESRYVFANAEVFNRKNDAERRTLEDIFWKRQFSSTIIRETNVYDRMFQEYSKGIDLLLENDRVKNDIFRWEHDLWHF